MKKILVIVFTLFSVLLIAQDGGREGKIKKRKYRLLSEDAVVLDVTSNMWRNAPQGIVQHPLRSLGFNLSFFFDKPIGYSSFAIAFGVSYALEHVQNNGVFVNSNGFNTTSIAPLQVPYTSNRFTSEWFDIPLELRLRTKKSGPFRLYLGAKAGINISNYHQFIDNDTKTRDYKIRNLNVYRYGVYARVGYAMLNLYSYYSLSDMFERSSGPQMAPISVGLSFLLR